MGNLISFLKQLLAFLKQRKKWWLIPIMVILLFFGILLVFIQASPLAPFIYTIF